MEKHSNPFDEFLKETLKGHQMTPPEEAKKAFLKEASAIISNRKAWHNWYYVPLLVVLISGIISVLYFLNENQKTSSGTVTTENIISSSKNDKSNINNSNLEATPERNKVTPSSEIKTEKDEYTVVEKNIQYAETKISGTNPQRNAAIETPKNSAGPQSDNNSAPLSAKPVTRNAAEPAVNETQPGFNSITTNAPVDMDSLVKPINAQGDTSIIINDNIASTDTSASSSVANPDPAVPARVKPGEYFAAGIYYMPEWVFNTYDGTIFSNSFGIEGIYYFGPLSIRTGVGISVFTSTQQLGVEYNGYLGSYNKLDSISFVFNESEHDFTPSYYMSSEKVWDTLTQVYYTDKNMRYTYVKVPLVFGYDFWQNEKFSVGIRVGTILSLLANSKQVSDNYSAGENKVVNVYAISPDYVNLNWQVTGGLNGSMRLNDNLWLELEPMVKYFYNSIYEGDGSTKKPVSVGVRGALIYKF